MSILVFQLQAALSSWGDTAVGEYRPSHDHPGISSLVGLLGAALGIRREDETTHAALCNHYGYAVGVQAAGTLLRDYHTAQVPGQATLKARPHASRRDELSVPKDELNTILSTRDYRQDSACLIAIHANETAPYPLDALADALRTPRFIPYLGRKSCPPGAPFSPQVIDATNALDAFNTYIRKLSERIASHTDRHGRPLMEPPRKVVRIGWGAGIDAGLPADLTTTRKDRPLRRTGWLFGDRTEYIALIDEEE